MTKWTMRVLLVMVVIDVVWIFLIVQLVTPYFPKIKQETEEKKNTMQEIEQWGR